MVGLVYGRDAWLYGDDGAAFAAQAKLQAGNVELIANMPSGRSAQCLPRYSRIVTVVVHMG